MTELYLFDWGDEPLPEGAERLLPSWRRERLAGLKNPAARQESLAAGLLWRFAMERRGVPPEAEVAVLPAGKPVLSGENVPWFSLSHSGRYVLCAVSGLPVGADVQERRAVRPSIARYFHPAEQAWLARPEAEEGDLFRLWTRKEAWVKAVSEERMLSLAEADVMHPLPGLRFYEYDLPEGFRAALCAGEAGPEEPVWVGRTELLSGDLCKEKQEDNP